MKSTVQWQGDNLPSVERLLEPFLARATPEGDKLHVTGLGLDTWLDLGDSLIIDGARLGISRLESGPLQRTAEWTGHNAQEIADFLKRFNAHIEVVGRDLYLRGRGEDQPIVLTPGDRLIKRGTKLVISKAGKDHRVS